MGVKLRKKRNSSGNYSLYLDICFDKRRHKEYLKGLIIKEGKSVDDKKHNKEVMNLVNQLIHERTLQLMTIGIEKVRVIKGDISIIEYFENYLREYDKSDIRNMRGAVNKFICFLREKKIRELTVKSLSSEVVFQYTNYLDKVCRGEGSLSYYSRFKKIIKSLVRERYITENPCLGITVKKKEGIIKDTLTPEELQLLYTIPSNNLEVKMSFLFSSYTGLSWVDVKELKWKHLDLKNMMLKKPRKKTGVYTIVPLHPSILKLIPDISRNDNDYVFSLPSHTSALKTLRKWMNSAGIKKHITFHCARHGTATNLINNNTDVSTVSKILGHSSLKYTLRYTHISEESKRLALSKLPIL
jgi:integrase/recombinase XerD